ncbi:hypothetical protein MAR_004218 [Mya arenaria]|uniref:Uncharacterized protein n=1 Tax=Mya arenaria TaxID=6604 RepID=A0ABY7EVX4_MYAAR|nr:hypothetical protein MAR_004218 [Mya arenaria]
MDEGKQKENDFKEQLEKRNALLIRTLEKLATAEDEIQSLEHERQALQEETKILRNSRSRILKGCKTHEKSLSILEKERQQLRDTIVELGNEVEVLNEEIIDLKDYESTIEAAKCANNTAEKKRTQLERKQT